MAEKLYHSIDATYQFNAQEKAPIKDAQSEINVYVLSPLEFLKVRNNLSTQKDVMQEDTSLVDPGDAVILEGAWPCIIGVTVNSDTLGNTTSTMFHSNGEQLTPQQTAAVRTAIGGVAGTGDENSLKTPTNTALFGGSPIMLFTPNDFSQFGVAQGRPTNFSMITLRSANPNAVGIDVLVCARQAGGGRRTP